MVEDDAAWRQEVAQVSSSLCVSVCLSVHLSWGDQPPQRPQDCGGHCSHHLAQVQGPGGVAERRSWIPSAAFLESGLKNQWEHISEKFMSSLATSCTSYSSTGDFSCWQPVSLLCCFPQSEGERVTGIMTRHKKIFEKEGRN